MDISEVKANENSGSPNRSKNINDDSKESIQPDKINIRSVSPLQQPLISTSKLDTLSFPTSTTNLNAPNN